MGFAESYGPWAVVLGASSFALKRTFTALRFLCARAPRIQGSRMDRYNVIINGAGRRRLTEIEHVLAHLEGRMYGLDAQERGDLSL